MHPQSTLIGLSLRLSMLVLLPLLCWLPVWLLHILFLAMLEPSWTRHRSYPQRTGALLHVGYL
jgi:hypothetical protein